MFIFKFVVPNFPCYSRIKINHYCAMFVLSKKSYVDLKKLRKDMGEKKNIFKCPEEYFYEFVKSREYEDLIYFLEDEMDIAKTHAKMYQENVGLCAK